MGFHRANIGLPGPFHSQDMRQTAGQTDRHHPSFYNASPYGGQGHNEVKFTELFTVECLLSVMAVEYV